MVGLRIMSLKKDFHFMYRVVRSGILNNNNIKSTESVKCIDIGKYLISLVS